MIPRLAILGRPNVGKSSLFNRLAGRRMSIVDATPGTTRDRIMATIELLPPRPIVKPSDRRRAAKGRRNRAEEAALDAQEALESGAHVPMTGRFVDLIDTGGWGVYVAEGKRFDDAGQDLTALTPDIEAQILAAARGADLILFVVDARTGPLPLDERIVELLRRERLVERVIAVANKVDDGSVESEIAALAKFGFGVPMPVSAKSGRGLAKLRARLLDRVEAIEAQQGAGAPKSGVAGGKRATAKSAASDAATKGGAAALKPGAPAILKPSATLGRGTKARAAAIDAPPEDGAEPESALGEVAVAIVGRRNAGKSSLVNALAGEPRVIVSEIAGTTRDAIDVRFEFDGRVFLAIDTAGVRKRKSWDGDIEYYANLRTQESIRRADVCILLLDAVEKVSQVEKNLAMQLTESYKPTVIAVNKWDLVRRTLKPADYLDYLEQELPGLAFAPIVFVSAAKGQGLRDLVAMCFNLAEQASHRESTGRVNAAVRRILEERGPSSSLGTKAKVFYVSQIAVKPPTLALVVNKPALFEGAYARYLSNRLRDELPFSEVPVRLIFSERRREEWGGDDTPPRSVPSSTSARRAPRAPARKKSR
ncbi:MAG: ribosome biogenesis GTPase Der [Phycisphaeraceae bacterium]|nr:ribosome biogenesis GTPase Der [Phycisphaeraceae bacterium]